MNFHSFLNYTPQAEFVKNAIRVDIGSKLLGSLTRPRARASKDPFLPEVFDYPLSKEDPRFIKIKELAEKLEQAAEGELDKKVLETLQIYTGGPDIINDVIFLKDKDKPWYERIGGRIWHLPHSPLHKLLYTLGYPLFALLSAARASPSYVPVIHAIVKATGEEPILLHELGHALDVGRALYKSEKMPLLKKILYQLSTSRYKEPTEIYSGKGELPSEPKTLRGVVFAPLTPDSDKIPMYLLREQLANSLSYQLFSWAVKKGLIDKKDAERIVRRRTEVVPLGYYTYAPFELMYPGFKSPLSENGEETPRKFRSMRDLMTTLREAVRSKAEKLTSEDIRKSIQEAAQLYLKSVGITLQQETFKDKDEKPSRKSKEKEVVAV